MGLWDKPKPVNEAGEANWPEEWNEFQAFDILRDSERPFKLHAVRVRRASTKWGDSLAIDLAVSYPGQNPSTSASEFYSGFSAGVAVMAKNATDRDFPVWCRIEAKDTGKGNPTSVLVPIDPAIAVHLEEGTEEDDIPF